jgi:hypothetical protein
MHRQFGFPAAGPSRVDGPAAAVYARGCSTSGALWPESDSGVKGRATPAVLTRGQAIGGACVPLGEARGYPPAFHVSGGDTTVQRGQSHGAADVIIHRCIVADKRPIAFIAIRSPALAAAARAERHHVRDHDDVDTGG